MATRELTFGSKSLPDIQATSHVVGACAVSHENCRPDRQGWMVEDFLAFKAILRTHPETNQAWMATALSKRRGEEFSLLNHGKQLFSSQIVKPMLMYDGHAKDMKRLFKQEISRRASLLGAEVDGSSDLVIIFCGPTTPEQGLIFGRGVSLMTKDDLRVLVPEALTVILVTQSLLTAGWEIDPDINRCRRNTDVLSRDAELHLEIASNGSTFARLIVENLSRPESLRAGGLPRNSSPFFWSHHRTPKTVEDLRTLIKTPKQNEAFRKFERAVLKGLQRRAGDDADNHAFNWQDDKDEWMRYCGYRHGPSLTTWKASWEEIPTNAQATPEAVYPESFFGTAWGGHEKSQVFHLKRMARFVYDVKTPDSTVQEAEDYDFVIESLLFNEPWKINLSLEGFWAVYDAVENRISANRFADNLAARLNLPVTSQNCRTWDSSEFGREKLLVRMQAKFEVALGLMWSMTSDLTVNEDDMKPYTRPRLFLACNIARLFRSGRIRDMLRYMDKKVDGEMRLMMECQEEQLIHLRDVQRAGLFWGLEIGISPTREFFAHDESKKAMVAFFLGRMHELANPASVQLLIDHLLGTSTDACRYSEQLQTALNLVSLKKAAARLVSAVARDTNARQQMRDSTTQPQTLVADNKANDLAATCPPVADSTANTGLKTAIPKLREAGQDVPKLPGTERGTGVPTHVVDPQKTNPTADGLGKPGELAVAPDTAPRDQPATGPGPLTSAVASTTDEATNHAETPAIRPPTSRVRTPSETRARIRQIMAPRPAMTMNPH